jgi:hypothetical protein
VQPLVLSPKVWMCMPRSALASLPVTFQDTVVSAPSEACSKVTVPLTLESPRITATVREEACQRCVFVERTASSSLLRLRLKLHAHVDVHVSHAHASKRLGGTVLEHLNGSTITRCYSQVHSNKRSRRARRDRHPAQTCSLLAVTFPPSNRTPPKQRIRTSFDHFGGNLCIRSCIRSCVSYCIRSFLCSLLVSGSVVSLRVIEGNSNNEGNLSASMAIAKRPRPACSFLPHSHHLLGGRGKEANWSEHGIGSGFVVILLFLEGLMI